MRGGLLASLPPNDQPWLAPKDSIARPNHISRLSLLANNTSITHDLEHSKQFINYKMVLKCSGSGLGKPDRLMSGSSCPKVPKVVVVRRQA